MQFSSISVICLILRLINFQGFKIFFFIVCGVYLLYLLYLLVRAYAELRSMPYFGKSSIFSTGPHSAVRNVSGNRCESDCRSRGCEFDPGTVTYFRGDWSWNNFYGPSPPFRWIIQEGLLSVTNESMCRKYWLTACSSLPRKSVVRWTDRPAMTIAVDLGRKAKKQTNNI